MALGATPMKYRSRYTGPQIEQLLDSVPSKLSLSHIVNDYSGGVELVASAESVRLLYLAQGRFSDPNYIKSLILSIPGALIFTQEDKDRIDALAGFFRGSFPNLSARNSGVDTVGFKGGELTFVIDDGFGQQELSYWDATALQWKKSQFLKSPIDPSQSYTTAANRVVISIDKTKFSSGKYAIRCDSATQFTMFELFLALKNTDVYWTTYAQLGTNDNLMKITSITVDPTSIQVNCDLAANVTVKVIRLGEF